MREQSCSIPRGLKVNKNSAEGEVFFVDFPSYRTLQADRKPRLPSISNLPEMCAFQAVKVAKLSPLFAAHALLKTSSSLELVGIDQNAGIS
jgi:hypothetical protein